MKEQKAKLKAKVIGEERNGYHLRLEVGGLEVFGIVSNNLRRNKISISVGDFVEVEMDGYDTSKGIIKYRF